MVRSPHAHADIRAIDTAAALAAPGVKAVYTATDLDAAGLKPIPCVVPLKVRAGTTMAMKHRPVLASGTVRHAGEPVAVVVAETAAQARDAAELVLVDYADRPAVVVTGDALSSPALVHGDAPGNLCFDWEKGDSAAVDAAFAGAARVVTLDVVNQRLVPNPMEGRGCLASFDGATGRTKIWVSSQGVHMQRDMLAKVFGVPADRFHVLTTDVGGGFGMKIFAYPEYALAAFATQKLGVPVRWTSERGEAFLSDDHGRDNLTKAELALDADGRFLALRVDCIANMGAWLSNYAPFIPTDGQCRMFSGIYRTPSIHARVRGVFTHTQPVDAYRGAGRPEAAYLIERLVDKAGRETGLGPVEIRRRNIIPPEAMPFQTPLGHKYDTGDFRRTLETALQRADADGFSARKAAARAKGELLGLGIASYIEACSGGPPEQADIRLSPASKVLVLIGTQSNGQGHETAYKQVLAESLGVGLDDVEVVQGDSDRVTYGQGTGGSRSVPVGGAAIRAGAAKLVEAAKIVAAGLLEVAEAEVGFRVDPEGGLFFAQGSNRTLRLAEVAAKATADADGNAFAVVERWQPPAPTFPNGTHVCEVAVDMETGVPRVTRYTVVDDFGTVMNPLLLAGQVHGGIAQGIGQALLEQAVFDPDSGQLLTGSFMDYALPRAADMPTVDLTLAPVPSTTNALGMKGAGEAGTIGACPAVINALVDALAAYGVTHIDMPATPEKLWRLIRQGAPALAAE
ncbi:xanthine dehydrogenase family protein molybdopterin-binding subunit [Aerophototrophica crusticola]|uniref:xanthine dehydrogenase family protein molybdopterin-binding subunit n=1 Tax=Aerophototrophica crusticola TaxID=1709002 RepID=UPI00384DBE41